MGVQINGDTGNISATKADYSGNVTIGGTLTYEDVTNIDSVGLITARNGIEVGARPGVGASISVDGNAEFAGIVTATQFKGDGSQLSNITSTTINTNADNRVITGSDTANTLNGESTLTHSSGVLSVNEPSLSTDAKIIVKGNDTNDHDIITAYSNSSTRGSFAIRNGTGIAPSFLVGTRGGSETLGLMTNGTERLRIDTSGNATISNGNLVIGTAGKGVDFSNAAGSAAGSASALLDDYEEGIYDGTLSVGSGTLVMNTSINQISYTKIGRQCTITGRVNVSSVSGLSGNMTLNLPFNVGASAEADHAGAGSVFMYGAGGVGSPGYLGLWTMWTDGSNSFVYFTYGDGTNVTAGAKVSAGTGVRFTFTYFTS